MLTESKQIENILPISAISIIQEDPSKFALAFLYLFTKNGWKIDPKSAREFTDWSKRSKYDNYENAWFDKSVEDPKVYKRYYEAIKQLFNEVEE